MDVPMSTNVVTAMDGKSKSIILITINWILVSMVINAISLTVHTTIQSQRGDIHYSNGLKSSPKQESLISHQTTICPTWEIWHRIEILWEEWSRHRFQEQQLIFPSNLTYPSKDLKFNKTHKNQLLNKNQTHHQQTSKTLIWMHLNLYLQEVLVINKFP